MNERSAAAQSTTGSSYKFLHLHSDGGVRTLILDHPNLNILHIPMLRELDAALAGIAADTKAQLLLIKGAGNHFSAGVDVADHTSERVQTMLDAFHSAIRHMLAIEIPIVAAVRGSALGGGCELSLACDLVLASEDAKFGQPEIRLGCMPPAAAVLLPRLVGRRRAMELILTGWVFDATEAQSMGLVTRIIPSDDFDATVDSYVAELAALSRPVLRLAKRTVLEGAALPLVQGLQRTEEIYLNELMNLRDAHEGLAAFMEKRAPVWKDR